MKLEMEKLKEIASSSPTASTMFTDWALRRRNRESLTLRRYKSRLSKLGTCEEKDYINTFRLMEQAGAGHLIYKNQRPVQWKWDAPIKVVGAGVYSQMPLSDSKRHSLPAYSAKAVKPLPKPGPDTTLAIPLPGGRVIRISMAQDLSDEDIASLRQALGSVKGKL